MKLSQLYIGKQRQTGVIRPLQFEVQFCQQQSFNTKDIGYISKKYISQEKKHSIKTSLQGTPAFLLRVKMPNYYLN